MQKYYLYQGKKDGRTHSVLVSEEEELRPDFNPNSYFTFTTRQRVPTWKRHGPIEINDGIPLLPNYMVSDN